MKASRPIYHINDKDSMQCVYIMIPEDIEFYLNSAVFFLNTMCLVIHTLYPCIAQ